MPIREGRIYRVIDLAGDGKGCVQIHYVWKEP